MFSAIAKALRSIKENVAARGLQDVLNPKRWWMFLNSKAAIAAGRDTAEEISWAEQIVFRMSRCPQCVAEGTCVHCKCPMDEVLTEKFAECSAKQWGVAMPAAEWSEYKKVNQIQIYVV